MPDSLPGFEPMQLRAGVAEDLAERATSSFTAFRLWISESYARAPALVLGLAALLVVPPLALIGLMLKRQSAGGPDATQIRSRKRTSGTKSGRRAPASESEPLWPSEAWLAIDSPGGQRFPIGRGVVRIGREDDNDICIADMTVHRYHAAVHRTDDAEFVITDLSSADGNGVIVNGRRVSELRLKDGDTIELGLARFKFVATPA